MLRDRTVTSVRERPAPEVPRPRRRRDARPLPVPRRPPQWWRDAAGAATWLSLLVVVALWVGNGGLQDLSGTTGVLPGLGRVTGLLAADLLLIQVLLMARIPAVERSYGQDELTRRHRLVGIGSFWLMIVHIVLLELGYAAASPDGLLRVVWDTVTQYPGMLLATAATVALTAVAATSVRRARRRLRYESWHLLHLYAYLGVGLSIPHQLWTGSELAGSPAARAYWWTLWLLAAGLLVTFRLGLPLLRSWRHRLVVAAVVREADDVVSVHLRGRNLHRLPVAAGQFFVWRFLDGPGWSRGHAYSLSAAPRRDGLRITVQEVGDGTRRLAGLRPGTRVLVEGPYGRLSEHALRVDPVDDWVDDPAEGRAVTLIGAGIGITPLRALLEALPYPPGRATLVHRIRRPEDAVFAEEMDEIAARRGARVVRLTGRRRSPGSWLPAGEAARDDTEALRRIVPGIAEHEVFICGSGPWTAAVRRAARRAGVPAGRIHVERFAP